MEPAKAQRLCQFCGRSLHQTRAKEHVVPLWLQKHLGIGKEQDAFVSYDLDGVPTQVRMHSLDDFVAGRVCEGCNNGWMRLLESAVSPFLPSLITCDASLLDLDDGQRLALARWAAKIAYCLDAALLAEPLVSDRHRRHLSLYGDRLPQGVVAVGATSRFSTEFGFFEMRNWHNQTLDGDRPALERRLRRDQQKSYKVALQFGSMVVVVGFWPNLYESISLVRDVHTAIWADRRIGFDRSLAADAEPYEDGNDFLFSAVHGIGTCPSEPHVIRTGAEVTRIRVDHRSGDRGLRGGRDIE